MSWALLEAAAGSTIDAVLEEDFTIQRAGPPAGDVNARKVANGAPVPFRAIWSETDVQRFPDSRGHASNGAREFGAGEVRVDIPTASLAFRPGRADVVTRLATGARYGVSHVGDNGFTRTVLILTARTG